MTWLTGCARPVKIDKFFTALLAQIDLFSTVFIFTMLFLRKQKTLALNNVVKGMKSRVWRVTYYEGTNLTSCCI